MDSLTAFNEGRLADAVKLATDQVRSAPNDLTARFVLAELLCFSGELERADAQLETAATLDPSHALGVAQFRMIIRGEVARQDFFAAGRPPEFLSEPTPELRARLEAAVALRAGDVAAATASLERAELARPALRGTCNEQRFEEFRDADDLLSSVMEVLTGDGRYFWIPWAMIESLTFEPPERPRDQLFRQAHMTTRGGPEGDVFIPVLYAGSARADREELRLGRATDWQGDAGAPVRGVGQRLLLVGDEGRGVLELESLEFDAHGSA